MCVFDVCVRLHFMSFTVFYCTSCIAFSPFFTYTVYFVCLYVSCLCLWATLPDLNKMMMMMMMMMMMINWTAEQ